MNENTCALAIIGDGAVGKSSIIAAFRNDGFGPVYKQTIGCDFYEKKLQIRGDRYTSLRVWDIGGQSINSKNLEKYISSSQIIFLTYDVTNSESFANLDDWISMVRKFSKSHYVYVVGNKVDLIRQRQVTESQHERFIIDNKLKGGLFLSAKTGENVVKAFYQAAGEAVGIKLTKQELDMYDKVITAYVVTGSSEEEGRTTFADEIEKEDLKAEERKKATESGGGGCGCAIA